MSIKSVWQKYIEDTVTGLPVAGASVEVRREADGTLATLYSDRDGAAQTNPITSDSNGLARFYEKTLGIFQEPGVSLLVHRFNVQRLDGIRPLATGFWSLVRRAASSQRPVARSLYCTPCAPGFEPLL